MSNTVATSWEHLSFYYYDYCSQPWLIKKCETPQRKKKPRLKWVSYHGSFVLRLLLSSWLIKKWNTTGVKKIPPPKLTIVIHQRCKKPPPDALASVTSVHQEKWEITCTSCDSLHNRHKLHNLCLCAQGTTYCVLQKHKLCLCNKYIYILFPTCVTFFGGR